MNDVTAEILEKCLTKMESGESLEACLADFPDHAAELEPLLRMTQQMSALTEVEPRPSFARNARLRLENQLNIPKDRVTFKRLNRHIDWYPLPNLERRFSMLQLLIATILALTAASGGVAYAANESNPGDVLHGLDLAMENVQLNLAPDLASEVQLRLEFASERLAEAQETFAEDDVSAGIEAMNEYGSEISDAAQLIGSADGADQDALNALLDAAKGTHQEVLTELLGKVPEQAKPGIQNALDAPNGVPGAAAGDHGNPNQTATPEPAETEVTATAEATEVATEVPTATPVPHGVGTDVSACAKAISQENAQALTELAKQNGVDYQYVLENFCVLGTLDKVREMLAGNPNVPAGVPAGPPSSVPGGKP